MATSGPVSVLDSGRREAAGTLRDRVTRRRSPARCASRSSIHELQLNELQVTDFDIDYRIPQPYRTSFSATHSVEKKVGRSRSLSPSSSLRSGRRPKGARSRSKSPKRVTYDTRVTVRHSDTEDSMFTELSSHEFESSPQSLTINSHPNKLNTSIRSADSGIDYSSQLRDISQQIYKMDWSPHNTLDKSSRPSHGILKDKQNSVNMSPVSPMSPVSNDSIQVSPQSPVSVDIGNKENSPDGSVSRTGDTDKRRIITREYNYDRTISYRIAVQEEPSDELKQIGEEIIDGKSPEDKGVRKERSNTLPTQNLENGQLSPMKKSVSTSISNFFRKISPRLGRKNSKDRSGKSSSASGSAQSLTVSDGASDGHESDRFSRSKVRRSFMKLIGRSKSRSKTRGDSGHISPKSKEGHDLPDANPDTRGPVTPKQQQLPQSTNRLMKSIERNSLSERDVYSKFKEKQSPNRPNEVSPGGGKPLAVRPLQDSANESGYNSSSITVDSGHISDTTYQPEQDRGKPNPPKSLDVMPPRAVKALQTSVISSISGDESIGECSLDVNLTGKERPSPMEDTPASEPSLLSQSTSSRQAVIGQESSEGTILSDTSSSNRGKDKGSLNNVLTESDKENAIPDLKSPSLTNSWDLSPQDPNRKPSYLKISCAVSGYGRYSQYSSYKNIEKRSPFSSTSSLRSIPSSPDMPSVQSPSGDRTRDECLRSALGQSLQSPLVANGQSTKNGTILNGHGQVHPTGDKIKDGEYFLQATQLEEDRLQSLCDQAETELKEHILPEEVSGRLRAAVGKGNLLVTQKFQQFRDLCSQHMYPKAGEKETKWEDLQGFWDMIKIQVDSVDDLFAEITLMRQNGWKEIPRQPSRRSSASSSPKSGSLSQGSTPCHTPGSKRKGLKTKDTPESSPERVQKARLAAKARDDARKKMLAEKRAAMKQQQANQEVEIYMPENTKK
ncbi:serine/arginine repetitive matrix protein 2-like isoform X1 [Haliotis rubra]|uniref:serine/arginine repetitive matrix protein 2-like isoform X1 n=1 Tax=Haliotis rubra TaxID=36100 RepID=UPI001EE5883E|nr:serine/arginine repetitive matrix protein 2-like isoform X1 [Haliotis rubra]XP_046553194.1 serine/arginine repetitive matrix protein 2-like isoform X1 [Haliotis rubra]XP_046553195.1 serine/arginine repetitive matrix protein 2-like isoform X1 [Haliotis rubra]XP_046553196.1 serine/arginine repetitive matrix protein 2-like isoform X1 [Haliotis rubra]XP_046553198.1 serine/arginine repetitive matrix protein 2-like isoform X1 [Haliotis rubra]XP_046553199.1 serine/arginine repetitive matrix protei